MSNRPRPVTDAPMRIPDSKAEQMGALLDETGILTLLDDQLAGRPGPAGLPIRTALIGLMLAIYYNDSATLAQAWRILTFSLNPTEHARLDLETITTTVAADDQAAMRAFYQRIHRAFDRMTTLTDPARADRRRRLPQPQAATLSRAWEDTDPDHLAQRTLLQEIVNRLVLAPVRRAARRGLLRRFGGDIGLDTTAAACWARPAHPDKGLASIEITAGWHHSAGNSPPTYGYSATLAVAARRRTSAGSHPQLALGLVVDTPGKRTGPNAITVLEALTPLGLPTGLLAVDRAYTDQTAAHFARPARKLGYRIVLDYKRDLRGIQGSLHGAIMIDGNLACPLIPDTLASATTALTDRDVRNPTQQLLDQIDARTAYYLKLKQSTAPDGSFRLQCPAAGPSPSVTCARFNRVHAKKAPARSKPINLADTRRRAAHTAGKPTVLLSTDELRRPPPRNQLPLICRQTSITVRPGDLGDREKLRQDLPYLSQPWTNGYKTIRAQTEGLNGRLKGHHIDIADPKTRLAHGRPAQTILLALMVTIANLQIIETWERTRQPPEAVPDTTPTTPAAALLSPPPQRGRPPPAEL